MQFLKGDPKFQEDLYNFPADSKRSQISTQNIMPRKTFNQI